MKDLGTATTVIEVGHEHRLADEKSLAMMVEVVEQYLKGNQETVEGSDEDGTTA